MIARSHRFHGYGSVKRVYRSGVSVRATTLSLKYAQRPRQRPYRVAIVVSRKVSKSAVVRNRIRRRLYEVVRRLSPDIAPGSDLVFTVFSDQLADQEPIKLEASVRSLLQKAGTLLPEA